MIIKKWKNMKDCWMKNNKKVLTETKSGSGAKKTKKYIHDDQLMFLKKNIPIKNTSSTLTSGATTEQTTTTNTTTFASISEAFAAPTTSNSSQAGAKRKKKDDADKAIIEMLSQREDRHLSFFRGILPSLQNFDEAKTIRFQIAVLQIIDNLDNNLSAFPSYQYPPYNYSQENIGNRTYSTSESNTQSPQNLPSASSVNTNLSDDIYFQ